MPLAPRTMCCTLLVCLMALTCHAGDITSGLVSYLKLNDGAGLVASDSSVNASNGTLNNFGPNPWITGRVNGGLLFDGVNDTVTVPDSGALRISTDITIAFWTRKDIEQPDWVRYVGKGNGAQRNYGVWDEAGAPQRVLWQLQDANDGYPINFFSVTNVPVGVWTHICCVKRGTTATIYINGVPDATITHSGIAGRLTNDPLQLGYGNIHSYLFGALDEVRVYDRGLSDADVATLFGYVDTPALATATAASATQVDLTFIGTLDPTTANNAANYSINDGVTVSAAALQLDGKTVRLTTSTLDPQTIYTLNAANVRSPLPPNAAMAPTQTTFVREFPTQLDNRLLAHFQLEEFSGDALDSSGNGHTGVLQNGLVRGAGKNGGASPKGTQSNGLGQYLQVAPQFNLKYTGREMTLACWVNVDPADTNGGRLISKPWHGGGNYNIDLNLSGGRFVQFALRGNNNTGTFSITSPAAISASAWHHIAATADATGVMRLYIDGVQVATGNYNGTIGSANWCPSSATGTPDQNTALAVQTLFPYGSGWDGSFGGQFGIFTVQGAMDDIRWYTRVLSAPEVLGLARDLPVVSITIVDPSGTEGSDSAVFRLTRTGSAATALAVQAAFGGTAAAGDRTFTYLTGPQAGMAATAPFTIPIGFASVDIAVTVVDDTEGEGPETLDVIVAPSLAAYNRVAPTRVTLTLNDNEPYVSLVAVQNQASERGPLSGIFTISRVNNTTTPLTVNYTIGGTAQNGTDYATITTSVNFVPGQTAVNVQIDPIGDGLLEGNETVTLTLVPTPGYFIAAASDTVTIADRSIVTVEATDPDAFEVGLNPGVITFTRTAPSDTALTVPYTIGGTAVAGTDYIALTGSVTFAPGSTTATVTVTPIDNAVLGVDTIVTVTIASNNEFAAGSPNTAAVTIHTDPELFLPGSGITVNPNPALAGQPVTFTGAPGTAAVIGWLWNYGDGSAAAPGQQTTHAYTEPGIYTVTVAATLADGTVSTGSIQVFIGVTVTGSPGTAPPSGGGLLIGGSGVTKASGGSLRIKFSRRETLFSGKVSGLKFSQAMQQFSLQGRQGSLKIGSGANAPVYFFVLDSRGRGHSGDVKKVELNLKKGRFSFSVNESALTDFLATLGASRVAPVPNLYIPVQVQVADKAFLAMTFNLDFKARGDTGTGRLRK